MNTLPAEKMIVPIFEDLIAHFDSSADRSEKQNIDLSQSAIAGSPDHTASDMEAPGQFFLRVITKSYHICRGKIFQ